MTLLSTQKYSASKQSYSVFKEISASSKQTSFLSSKELNKNLTRISTSVSTDTRISTSVSTDTRLPLPSDKKKSDKFLTSEEKNVCRTLIPNKRAKVNIDNIKTYLRSVYSNKSISFKRKKNILSF